MKYLLDVNALIAVLWQPHVHFSRANKWMEGKMVVTCPVSEMGFLRIGTHAKVLSLSMPDARALLENFVAQKHVEFLPADMPALKSPCYTSGQVTDVYLAELAQRHGMKLATFDSGINHPAVIGI